MATYNRSIELPASIGSVVSQSYLNWELLVWDDGSNDDTETVVKSFNDPRIRYFFDKNHGQSYSLNQAIKASKGDLIAFLDDDDEWEKQKIQTQVKYLLINPQIDFLFCNFLNISKPDLIENIGFDQHSKAMEGLVVNKVNDELFIVKDRLLQNIVLSNFILPSTVVIRKSVFENVGYFCEELRNSMDFELWWRLGLSGVCFAYLSKIYVKRNKKSGSLSSPSINTYKNKLKSLDLCIHSTISAGRIDLLPLLYSAHKNPWQNMIVQYGKNGDGMKLLSAFVNSLKYGFSFGTLRMLGNSLNHYVFYKFFRNIKNNDN